MNIYPVEYLDIEMTEKEWLSLGRQIGQHFSMKQIDGTDRVARVEGVKKYRQEKAPCYVVEVRIMPYMS